MYRFSHNAYIRNLKSDNALLLLPFSFFLHHCPDRPSPPLFMSCRHEHTLWLFLRSLLALILPGLGDRETLCSLLPHRLIPHIVLFWTAGKKRVGPGERARWRKKEMQGGGGQRTKQRREKVRCDFANMKTRRKFTIAKMDIFCFWSQGWFDSIPGLKFWCCYYVSRWEKDEEQKERRRRDVWYEFLLRRTVISKPVGKHDLWWNLQDIHKEWYLCMREVPLWSQSGVADKMPTRCYKSKRRGRGRRKYFIFSSKCFDVFVWSMSEILWKSPHHARREMWNLMGERKTLCVRHLCAWSFSA